MLIRMIWQSPGLWEARALFVKYYEELLYPFSSRLVCQTEIQNGTIAEKTVRDGGFVDSFTVKFDGGNINVFADALALMTSVLTFDNFKAALLTDGAIR